MSVHKQKAISCKINLQFRIFFRRYPAILYVLKWLGICLGIGALTGTASAGFLQSLDRVTRYREAHLWLILLLPAGGFGVGLLYHYWGKDVAAGNNLLLGTIRKPQAPIPFRMAPFVYIGTMVTHLLGGSAGREGTALQMAGAIADRFSKPLGLTPGDRKTLIIAAMAAGFGSVFGTPLAGAVFALEVVLIGKLRYHAIFPAFAAAIIADQVTRFWHAHHAVYEIGLIPEASLQRLGYALIAGIAFGLCAAAFSKAMHYLSRVFTSRIPYPPLRPFTGGIIIVIAIWIAGTTKYIGLGIPAIVQAFDQQLPAYDFILKMAFTLITLSAGFKGGEVTPLFFIGAALGSSLSLFIPLPVGLFGRDGFCGGICRCHQYAPGQQYYGYGIVRQRMWHLCGHSLCRVLPLLRAQQHL